METLPAASVERLPPHNLEAEQSLLGSLLIDRDAIIRVASFIKPDDFYHQANGLIYRAIFDLYNRREPTDFITLSDELGRRDQLDHVGGIAYLTALLNAVPTAVHVEYYGRIVERTATLRRLIDAGAKIVAVGYRDGIDTEDALDEAERAIFEVSQKRQTKDFVSVAEVLDRFFDQIDYMQQHRGEVVGVGTGFNDLDQLLGGLQRSDLVIVAARPSMGKSSLALGLAYGAAVGHGKTVGIFTLEMSAEQLVQRLLSMETGVDAHRLRLGQIDDGEWDRISRAFGRLAEAKIYLDDQAGASVMDVRSKARRLQAEYGLDLVIIDYLQLMSSRRTENRVQEISEISRGLKGLARELNVPVVALSQLSRAVESRSDHRPMLSDLRESGCLTSDTPVFLPDEGGCRPIAALAGRSGFNVLAVNPLTWRLERRQVLRAFPTGSKPVFRLTTRLGRTIRATANHQFLTIDGWRRLDSLDISTRIAAPREPVARSQGHAAPPACHPEWSCRGAAPPRHENPGAIRPAAGSFSPQRSEGSRRRHPQEHEMPRQARHDGRGEVVIAAHATADVGALLAAPGGPRDHNRSRRHGSRPAADGRSKQRPYEAAALAVSDAVGSAELRALAASDVYWDEIVAIEADGVEDVYDLTVEDLHNFVAADIIVHNSIEQDADVVLFIYREDKYEEESDKKGIAEIIVAKHRNGPVGSINLRFFERTARFADLEVYRGPEG